MVRTDVRLPIKGRAGSGAGAGSLDCLRVAQSDAVTGSSAVLSGQLKAGFKGPLLLPVDSCNRPLPRCNCSRHCCLGDGVGYLPVNIGLLNDASFTPSTRGGTTPIIIVITGCDIPLAVTSPGHSMRGMLGQNYPQVAWLPTIVIVI